MSKAPEFLHLTFREQTDIDYTTTPPTRTPAVRLGFANAYEPKTQAYAKRYDTQMDWAYDQYGWGYEIREDGVYISEHLVWNSTFQRRDTEPVTKAPEHLQPVIIKNEPMTGFKISHSVSRYSTSNKLWRIEDPRGFELEISTGNMEELLMTGTVTKGVFMGVMQWKTAKMLQWIL